MKNIFHHVARHAKNVGQHVRKHHKKYLFGIFGGFAVAKMFIFFTAAVGMLNHAYFTFADNECTMTGQTYVEEVTTCTTLSGYYTSGAQECTTIEGYYTGGTVNESGDLVDQTYVDPVEECVMGEDVYVEPVEQCTTIEGYWTGGELLCLTGDTETGTGDTLTGDNLTGDNLTGNDLTGNNLTGNNLTGSNLTGDEEAEVATGTDGVCTAADVTLLAPLSGSFVKGLLPIAWSYLTQDCLTTGNAQTLTLQLYDHNHKWISLTGISSSATGYLFNTVLLSGYANASGLITTGMYTVANASGVVSFTGVTTGVYTNFATGYQIRLVDSHGVILSTGDLFVIDNVAPTLTGVALTSSDAVSGVVTTNDDLVLTFTASEELIGVTVLVDGTGMTLESKNGLIYTYEKTVSSGFHQGLLTYSIAFADLAGSTGLVSATGTLSFDSLVPVLSGMALTGTTTSGLTLSFVSSEIAKFAFSYAQSGAMATSYTGTDYQTGHSYMFTGIQANAGYTFRLKVTDVVGNAVMYSGSFVAGTTGVLSFVSAVYVEQVTTGTLLALTNILKEEINKFNMCKSGFTYTNVELEVNKNTYTLHLPEFKKAYVKKIVSAFSLLILDKVEKNRKLTAGEINEITDKFDNFLIVLKLLRDDDNSCKQNLSNYHITQFTRALDEYGIYFK